MGVVGSEKMLGCSINGDIDTRGNEIIKHSLNAEIAFDFMTNLISNEPKQSSEKQPMFYSMGEQCKSMGKTFAKKYVVKLVKDKSQEMVSRCKKQLIIGFIFLIVFIVKLYYQIDVTKTINNCTGNIQKYRSTSSLLNTDLLKHLNS